MPRPDLFVPAFQTLSPWMLLRRPRFPAAYPLAEAGTARFFFARNALFRLAQRFDLAGGEVLLPAYHHGVEVEAYRDAGARLAFYRVDERMAVDLEDVERRIGPATRALHLTHFLGIPGPARAMREIADRRGILLIEDCAHALLSLDGGEPLGRHGHAAVFCLYKGLPLPHGGLLLVSDRERSAGASPPPPPLAATWTAIAISTLRRLALRGGAAGRTLRRLALGAARRALRAAGAGELRSGSADYDPRHRELGMSRLVLRLARVVDPARARELQRENFLFLARELADFAPPIVGEPAPGVAPFCYPLRVADNRAAARWLTERGVEAVDFWRASHPACDLARFPEVARLRRTVLELPCHPDLDRKTLARIVELVRALPGELRAAAAAPATRPRRGRPEP
jgi:dTDP-4-amino-4,6-dideoxygalactose transaminase